MSNREHRRHPDGVQDPKKNPEQDERAASRPQDALDPRKKSEGHGKKTADKWNQ
jgi:hypothetical protein